MFLFLLSKTFATTLGLTFQVASWKIRYLTNFTIPNMLGLFTNCHLGPITWNRTNIYSFYLFFVVACVLCFYVVKQAFLLYFWILWNKINAATSIQQHINNIVNPIKTMSKEGKRPICCEEEVKAFASQFLPHKKWTAKKEYKYASEVRRKYLNDYVLDKSTFKDVIIDGNSKKPFNPRKCYVVCSYLKRFCSQKKHINT